MKHICSILILYCVAISCDTEQNSEPETLDFKKFTIEIPETWQRTQKQGYDSYVEQIITDYGEEINFDLGGYSNELNVDNSTHVITRTRIDHKKAKIVSPKNFGLGTTGVYFDSLDINETTKFQMSGVNLRPETQVLLLAAIETLEFK